MSILKFLKRNKDKPAPATVNDSVTGVFITLHIDDEQVLFVVLDAHGSINRMGTGAEGNTEKELYIGVTSPDAFHRISNYMPPVMEKWIGVYTDPKPAGRICKLNIGFFTADRGELHSFWQYGTQSQGPPPEVSTLVIESVNETNPWYASQKDMTRRG